MQRKVPGGSLSFVQNWVSYRDGFGSATGNDNYWLGLDKVYRLMHLGSVTLRVEVDDTHTCTPRTMERAVLFSIKLRRFSVDFLRFYTSGKRNKIILYNLLI